MLARAHRFHGHSSLRPLYQKGKALYSRNLKVLWQPTQSSFRVAVVVSKKVDKSAVVRNRIRRRIYGIVFSFLEENEIHADLVFLVQNVVVAELSPENLTDEVESVLKKISHA